jgi:biotin operon repressor
VFNGLPLALDQGAIVKTGAVTLYTWDDQADDEVMIGSIVPGGLCPNQTTLASTDIRYEQSADFTCDVFTATPQVFGPLLATIIWNARHVATMRSAGDRIVDLVALGNGRLPWTQDEVGSVLNMRRETVSSKVAELRRSGVLAGRAEYKGLKLTKRQSTMTF